MTAPIRRKRRLWRAALVHQALLQSRVLIGLGPSLEFAAAPVWPQHLRLDPAREQRRLPIGTPIEPGDQPLLRKAEQVRPRHVTQTVAADNLSHTLGFARA